MPRRKEIHKDLEVIAFPSKAAFRKWIQRNHARDVGFWLKFGKKACKAPTITYEEAREVAITFGWIDGQLNRYDDEYYLVRFTPRRPKSAWSKINREIAETLISEKQMEPSGLAQVKAAKSDGRWEAAYDSPSKMQVPSELKGLLRQNPEAQRRFDELNAANRYAFLYRIQTAKRKETRTRHVEKMIEMLLAGEIYHPKSKNKSNRETEAVVKKKSPKVSSVGKPAKKRTAKKVSKKKVSKAAGIRVALLRGINVGGKNKLKMAELCRALTEAGLKDVDYYKQSGNLFFTSRKANSGCEKLIETVIRDNFGFEVTVIVRAVDFYRELVGNNPFPKRENKHLAATVLSKNPSKSEIATLKSNSVAKPKEEFEVHSDVIYLYLPLGQATTKLTNQYFEKQLDCRATTRNWNTLEFCANYEGSSK